MKLFTSLMRDYLLGIQECDPIQSLEPLLHFVPEVPVVSREDTDPFLCGTCLCPLYEPVSLLTGESICRHCYTATLKERCEVAYSVNVCLAGVAERHKSDTYKAMQLRLHGNELTKEKKWLDAISIYNQALLLMEGEGEGEGGAGTHVILSNLSLAEVSSGMLEEALRDADKCIKKAPFWMKGYYRRSSALEKMGLREEALVMCLMVVKSGRKEAQVAQSISRIGEHLLKKARKEGIESVCEMIWQHMCVEREKVEQVGQVIKWHRLEIVSLSVDEVECSLCCRLFYRPTTTPCGHTLCEPCLNRCLDHNTTCPVCRSPLTHMLGKYQHKPCVALETIVKESLPQAYAEREKEHLGDRGTEDNLTDILSTDGYEETFEVSVFVCSLAFPFVQMGLHIFEPRYRLMIRQAWESESRCFGMCAPLGDTFTEYGTILRILSHQMQSDGRVLINTVGVRRFRVVSQYKKDGYVVARVSLISDIQRRFDPTQSGRMATFYGVLSQVTSNLSMNLGHIPGYSEGEGGPDGPGWIWYGLHLISELAGVSSEVLSGTCGMARFQELVELFNTLSQRN